MKHEISLRVSKKEFQENKAFQLSLTREVKQIAKQNREMCDNLQMKYDNLDRFYLPVQMYTAFRDEQNKVTANLEQRLKDIENELELAGES